MAITGLLQNHNHDDRYIQKLEQNKVLQRWQGNSSTTIKINNILQHQTCYVYLNYNGDLKCSQWVQFPVEFCNGTSHIIQRTYNQSYADISETIYHGINLSYSSGILTITPSSGGIRILKIYSTL